jgi:protein SCO1/2
MMLGFVGRVDGPSSAGTPSIGGPFRLLDTEGYVFSDTDLLGKYYLIYFGFTHCPDICPEELDKMSRIGSIVRERNAKMSFVPVFITCDPERDTPERIKAYLKGNA